MNESVLKLLNKIDNGARPDLKSVKLWLDTLKLPITEYEEALESIEKNYKLTPDAFDVLVEDPNKSLDYTDDFLPLMHDVKGWLKDYIEHTKGMEAPTAFHFGTGLTILGASLKRRTWIDQGTYKIYPPVQTMLVGPSGKVKKSTASRYGVNLTHVIKEGYQTLYNLLQSSGTGEALTHDLAQITKKTGEGTGLLFVSELGVFLGKQEYNVNLVQILTDLFDSPDFQRKRTKGHGDEIIKNATVSALLCSNEEWLSDAIPNSAFGGGFFGRMLVFYQASTDRCFPRPRIIREEEKAVIRNGLEPVRFVKGATTLTPQADGLFEKIYKQHNKEWPEEERIIPFYERMPDHILRISMLLAVSEDTSREIPIISERNISKAKEILDWIYKYLPRVYAHLGGSKFGSDHYRIYEIIRRAGGHMEERDLGRRIARRLSKKQLTEHLETMLANGVIQRITSDPWEGKYSWKLLRKMT